MWQPTQYYHTKMQLAKMELEGKLLSGKYKKPKRETGSGPIMEKMRILELTDEIDEEELYEDDAAGREMQDPELSSEVQTEAEFAQEPEDNQPAVNEKSSGKVRKKQKKLQKENIEPERQEASAEIPETEVQNEVQSQIFENEQKTMRTFSVELMQDRIIWAEILGEPVSVKRRKKRVERLYGNQSHADRR